VGLPGAANSESYLPVADHEVRAFKARMDRLEREAIRAEPEAFGDSHDEHTHLYEGEHIAFYQGRVVAHDAVRSRLAKRVRE